MITTTALATALLLPITGRAPRRSRCACACLADLSLQYELASEELSIDDGTDVAGPLTAYITEEQPREDGEPVNRALILLPDASGWQDVQTRRLADRLAIFCSCVVLVPDLLRGEAACTQAQDDEAYASWLSGLPPERVDQDVRDCVVVLRADRRIRGPVTMLGLGLGGGQAVRANAGLELAGTALICPRHYERATLAATKAPTLALFDGDAQALDEARDALLGPGAAPSTGEASLSTLRVPELRAGQHVRSGPIGRDALPQDGRPASRHVCLTGLLVALSQERLAAQGLPTKGRKAELLERLQSTESQRSGAQSMARPRHLLLSCDGAALLCNEGRGGAANEQESPSDLIEDALLYAEGWLSAHMAAAEEDLGSVR